MVFSELDPRATTSIHLTLPKSSRSIQLSKNKLLPEGSLVKYYRVPALSRVNFGMTLEKEADHTGLPGKHDDPKAARKSRRAAF